MEELIREVSFNVNQKKNELLSVLLSQYGIEVDLSFDYYNPVLFSFPSHSLNYDLLLHDFDNISNECDTKFNFVALNINPINFKSSKGFIKCINKRTHVLFENYFSIFIKSSIRNINLIFAHNSKICRDFIKKHLNGYSIIVKYSENPFLELVNNCTVKNTE